jgi:hypothetical protein
MNNRLKEFEELLLDNTLFKCRTKPWEIKIPSGRSGGKLFTSSQKNKFRII